MKIMRDIALILFGAILVASCSRTAADDIERRGVYSATESSVKIGAVTNPYLMYDTINASASNITLRDIFASQCMATSIQSRPFIDYKESAKQAYEMADALLEERSK